MHQSSVVENPAMFLPEFPLFLIDAVEWSGRFFIDCLTSRNKLMAHQTSAAKDKSEDGLHFQSDLLWFFVFWG